MKKRSRPIVYFTFSAVNAQLVISVSPFINNGRRLPMRACIQALSCWCTCTRPRVHTVSVHFWRTAGPVDSLNNPFLPHATAAQVLGEHQIRQFEVPQFGRCGWFFFAAVASHVVWRVAVVLMRPVIAKNVQGEHLPCSFLGVFLFAQLRCQEMFSLCTLNNCRMCCSRVDAWRFLEKLSRSGVCRVL